MKTYTRRLNPRFISGAVLTFTFLILVGFSATAQISITGPNNVCTNETGVVYTATPGTSTYTWTISSGGTIATGQGTSVITVNWGGTTQTVILSVVATGGSVVGTASKTVTVNARPSPMINGTEPICQSTTGIVYFTEPGMTGYTWSITPSTPFTTGPVVNAITVDWPVAGTFTITANYTNASGCQASPAASKVITVNQAAAPAVTSGPGTACTGTTVAYATAASKNNYIWSVSSGGTIVSGTGTNSILVNWFAIGTHTITVTYTEPGTNCWALSPGVKSVLVSESPVPVVFGADTVCSNGTYTYWTYPGKSLYTWTPGAGATILSGGGTSTVTVRFTQAGNTTVSVNYTDPSSGCQGLNAATKNVKVIQSPSVDTISNRTYCHAYQAPFIPVTGPVPGTTFYWWNSYPSIGLPESGTGNISAFTASNTTTLPVMGTVTIEPVANGCTGSTRTFTITVNPKPEVDPEVSQVVCNGSMTDAVVFSGTVTGTVYQWRNSRPSIGLDPEGVDSIPSFAAVNTGTVTVSAVITVTPVYSNGGVSCSGTPMTFTITVKPSPSVTPISDQVHCHNAEVPVTPVSGPVTGTTFEWSNDNPLIGLAGSGTGDILPFTASNTTTAPVKGIVTITTVANGCPGSTRTYTVTVNPTPDVDPEENQAVCHGYPTTAVVFSGTVTGTVYHWRNSQPSIGIGEEGVDSIPSFAAVNTGTVTVSAVITVTPVYSNGGIPCSGDPMTFTITVTPQLKAGSLTASQTVCYGLEPELLTTTALSGGVPPYLYDWEISTNGTEFTAIAGASSMTYQPGPVTANRWYRVRQSSSSGCGSVYTNQAKISVSALPVIGIEGPAAACMNATNNVYSTAGGMTNYQWGVVGGIITAGGTSTSTTVTVTWNTLGSQQVSLNYTTPDGCNALTPATKTVTVQNTIIPTIDGPNPACTLGQSEYTTESGMLNYTWALPLGGGTIFSGQGTSRINVIWSTPGNRSVSVIYNDALGCTTLTPTVIPVTVNTSPAPTIRGTTPICQGSAGVVYFTEEGMSGYTWSVTGGTITGGGNTSAISVTWNIAGTQTVTVNYTNSVGCQAPAATFTRVTVQSAATPTIAGPTTACTGTTTYYTTQPGMTLYNWSLTSGGTISSGAGTYSIGVTWASTGTHTVTVTYLNALGCPTLIPGVFGVTINQSPQPMISGADTVCLNGTVTYTTEPGMALYVWTVGAGGIITSGAGTSSITVKWTQAGAKAVTVNYTNPAGGCQAVSATVKNITVYSLPVPMISGPNFGCALGSGNTFSTEPGMTNYVWSVSTGGTVSPTTGTNTVTASWSAAGLQTIFVGYTDLHGCSSSTPSSYNITINARPVNPVISGPAGACAGSVVVYSTIAGMTTYSWSVSSGGTILTNPSNHASTIQVQWNTPGEQTVGVNYTNISGCDALTPGTLTTTVYQLPVVNAVENQMVCNGSLTAAVTFSGTGTSYSWTNNQPSIGLPASGTGNIGTFTATNMGSATLTATISVTPVSVFSGVTCSGSTMTFTLTINPSPNVSDIQNQSACNGSITTPTPFNGDVTGTLFTWTNSNQSIGIPGSGTGNIGTFTATNTGTSPQTATITVTPSISPAPGLICTGSSKIFEFTVYPTPIVNPVGNQTVCHGGMTQAVIFTGTGTTYSWTNSNPTIGLAGSGNGNIPSFTAINTGTIAATATITVTPYITPATGLTCTGQPILFSYMVYPQILAGAATASQSVCYNTAPVALTATPPTGGTSFYSYLWQRSSDNISFEDITGATGMTYQPGSLTVTTWYRQKQISSDGCGTVYTNAVKISIHPLPVPAITGAGAACINSTNNIYSTQQGMSGYNWSVTGGVIAGPVNNSSVNITWNTAGIQTVSVSYTDLNNCVAATPGTKTVSVQSTIVPSITGPDPACTSIPCTYLTESGMLNYVWTLPLGGGTIVSGQGSGQITVLWNTAGNRNVGVIYNDALGCTVTIPTVKPVTVNASPAPTITGLVSICQGSAGVVYFTESGMAGYTWSVTGGTITGGGGTSVISVNWTTAGTQSVTVNYSNLAGCTAPQPTLLPVTVQPAATPLISGQTPVCTGTTTYYTTASGMSNYTWNLDAGGTIVSGSGTNTIGIRWSSIGTFNISVAYLNAQGCPTLVPGIKAVQVNQSPLPVITGADTICLDGTLVFSTDPGMAMYTWSVSTGGLITSGQGTNMISVKWIQSGPGTVSVNYVNPAGGCQAVTPTVKNITVYAPPVPVISGPQYSCTGGPGADFYTAAGMSGYTWTATPDGVISAGSGTNSVTVLWNTAGLQSVYVVYTDQHGCTAQTPSQFNLAINARPADPVIAGPPAVCIGTQATYSTQQGMTLYQWTVSNGGTIITAPSDHSSTIDVLWHTSGPQSVMVTYQNTAGCFAALPGTFSVTVNPLPVPVLTGPASTCNGATGNTFTTLAGQTGYNWTVSPDGTITAGGTPVNDFVTVTWNSTGIKQVGVNYTTPEGCTAAKATTYTVTVNALPVPVITGASTGCQNTTGNVYFTEPGMTSYFWTVTSEGVITSGQGTRTVTITWLNSGSPIITVNYLNSNGCQASVATPLMVAVHPAPTPSITSFSDPTDLVCQNTGGHIYFTEPGMSSYAWTVSGPAGTQILSGGSQSTCNLYWGGPGPTTGTIRVSVTNGYGCSAASPLKTVNITQPVVVGASIVVSQNPVLTGSAVTFTASTVNGGTNPVYQWRVNGIIAGTNSPTFTYVPSEGDSVVCTVTSNHFCVINPQVTSNTIIMGILYGVSCPGIPTVTYMGKTYHTVQIGTQCWFKENLDAGTRINGNQEQSQNGILEKYCYQDLESNCSVYGGLYQWNEMMQYLIIPGVQGICPQGWHIPADDEWSVLTTYLSGESVAGGKMKEVGTSHWLSPNTGAVNTSGFTCLGGGLRFADGMFGSLKEFGYNYSSTQNSSTNAWTRYLTSSLNAVGRNPNNKSLGLSVRCLKDTCSAYPPIRVTVIPSVNPVCAGTSVTFTAYPVNGGQNPVYQWKVNGVNAGSNNPVFSYVPAVNDVVTCVLTSSLPSPCLSGNPATSGPVAMVVYPLPVPLLTGPVNVCPGVGGMIYNTDPGMTGYTWTVSAGGTITSGQHTGSINVTWNNAGVQTVTVSYIDQHGCVPATPSVKTVYVNQPVVPTISGPWQVCLNQTVAYSTETGMSLYNWSVGSGGIITSGIGTAVILVRWTQSGFRTVTVNYANPQTGCQALTPVVFPVTVNPLPAPVITGPSTVCEGSTGVVYFTDPGMSNYAWVVSPGGIITAGNGTRSITVSWITPGTQTLTVNYTNTLGCQTSSQTVKNVWVSPYPVPSIQGPSQPCTAGVFNYTTETGMSQYNWSVSPGGTILSGEHSYSVFVQWNTTGPQSMEVNYIDAQGCSNPVPTIKPISVLSPPVPSITGNSLPCASSVEVYVTEPGMTNYQWTVLPGGVITGGQGTYAVTVVWQTPGFSGMTVNYTTPGGCRAEFPTAKTITVLPTPVPVISGLSETTVGTTTTYTTDAGMIGYQWSVSAGGTIVGGAGTYSIQVSWNTTGNQTVNLDVINASGCHSVSPTVFPVKVLPPSLVMVQNITIGAGQSACYDAVQTIVVAGSGTHFIVQSGGSATFIAGQNILMLPGTSVQPGGYLHGYITTNGMYCGMNMPSIVTVPTSIETPVTEIPVSGFKVYPNPNTGIFNVECPGERVNIDSRIDIYSMKGERIFTGELREGGTHKVSIEGRPTGIYILRIISGDQVQTFRIVKQ
ncbi:MAG: FISUMP domain-containing protein [Bacteroidales bacterium]|nr:FISUMP domain-containing protein [Bacteroidales bacterium]